MATRAPRLGVLALCAILGVTSALLHVVAANLPPLRELETNLFDLQLQWRGPKPPGPEIAIVVVDERTLSAFGRWPLSRERYAELVGVLQRAGARVIGFDILFTEPEAALPAEVVARLEGAAQRVGDPALTSLARAVREDRSTDEAFAKAIRAHRGVALPFTFGFGDAEADASAPALGGTAYRNVRADSAETRLPLQPTDVLAPIPMLASAAAGLGHSVLAFDVDGAPRFDYPVLEHDLEYFPSMAVRIAQLYLGVKWEAVQVELGHGIAIGDTYVPTDGAMRLAVNYRGPSGTYPTLSFLDVVRGIVPAEQLRDRIILVGAHLIGTRDMVETPFTSVLPGVERLATIVDSILHHEHLRRPIEAPLGEAAAILLGAFAVGLAVAHLSTAASAIAAALVVASIVGVSHLLLTRAGLWFFVALPVAAIVTIYLIAALYRHGLLDRDHRYLRGAFARYLAPKMIDRLLAHPERLDLGGELREMTVMFCDMRSSTTLGELLDPQRLTHVLNEVLTPLSDIVLQHDGTIARFVGDSIMAFWNAPVDEPRHAELACRAALAMQATIPAINARLAEDLPFPVRVGIALNTGPCVVGNFGSRQRFDYGAMGDAVNVAARLQEESKTFALPIVVSAATAAAAPMMATVAIAPVQLRGREGVVDLHALVGDDTSVSATDLAAVRKQHALLIEALRQRDGTRAAVELDALARTAPASMSALLGIYRERIAVLAAGTDRDGAARAAPQTDASPC
jgi:adenylate cyclase